MALPWKRHREEIERTDREIREEVARTEPQLARAQRELVDRAARLVRLEAEVDVYMGFRLPDGRWIRAGR